MIRQLGVCGAAGTPRVRYVAFTYMPTRQDSASCRLEAGPKGVLVSRAVFFQPVQRLRRFLIATLKRSSLYALACAALLAVAGTVAPTAAQADITDSPAGALASLFPPAPELIDRAGDHDWYAAPSQAQGEFQIAYFVGFKVTAVDPSCPAAKPLLVSLHNPEVHWMRTYAVSPGDKETEFPILASDGRYLVAVSAADPGCAGLEYVTVQEPLVAPSHFEKGAAGCRIAKGDAKVAAKRVKSKLAQIRATRSAKTRRRLQSDLKKLEQFSHTKQSLVKTSCA